MARKVTITLAFVLSAMLAAAATIDKRIVGGEDAKADEFPFIVSIQSESGTHYCAGSLLDSTTVLTAGHCITSGDLVRAGKLNYKTGGVEAKIASCKKHPRFGKNFPGRPGPDVFNDIGILKLSTPIEKSETISYAMLPANGSDPMANSMAIVAGWGHQIPLQGPQRGYAVDNLSKAIIPIHAREICSEFQPDVTRSETICAGGNGKNSCRFDSGGPLIDQETGQLIGLVSFGLADKKTEFRCNLAPALYTRVGSYISFINEYLGALPNPEPDSKTMTKADEQSAGTSTSISEQDRRAKENELCSTAKKPNKYGVSEDECRQQFAQCFEEPGKKKDSQISDSPFEQLNENANILDSVVKCMNSRF